VVVEHTVVGQRQNHTGDICPSTAAMHVAGHSMAVEAVQDLGHEVEQRLVAAHTKLEAGKVAEVAVRQALDCLLY